MDSSADKKQLIVDELSKIPAGTTLSFNAFKSKAPVNASEIENAYAFANKDSHIDKEAKLPDTVTVYADQDKGTFIQTSPVSEDGKSHLNIQKDTFSQKSYSDMVATYQHEAGHEVDAISNPDMNLINMKSGSFHRETEFEADRYADADKSINKLLDHTQKNPEEYNFNSVIEMHPNDRERINALAQERAGNEIFGHAGRVSVGDGTFHPNRDKEGVPVTEDGRRVTNWDSELAPAIKSKVDKDMQLLDHLVDDNRDGKADLSNDDIKNFQQHMDDTSKKFKQEHQPQYETSDDTQSLPDSGDKHRQLAYSFRQEDFNNQAVVQRNIAQEPRMASAYTAYHLVSDNVRSSGLQPGAQEVVMSKARENIANGIEQGDYPNVQRQEFTQNRNAGLELA